MIEIKTLADVQRLLKIFGCIIYTGDPEGDRQLMLEEIKELQEMGMIDREVFIQAYQVLSLAKKN